MRLTDLFSKIISTVFYAGYFPLIPGTFASFVATLLICLVGTNHILKLALTVLFLVAGFLFSGRAERLYGRKDARCIVIDEFAGVFISFMFLPYNLTLVVVGFLVFRIMDALKPYPASFFEKQPGSTGIMSDDIVAGIYTNIVLQLVLRFTSLSAS